MGIENPELLSDDNGPMQNVTINNADVTPDEDAELNELQDVEELLARPTADGKGDDEIPPANFVSYAADDVEKDES